jgi:hypothetical protein
MQEVALAARPDVVAVAGAAPVNVDQLWRQLEAQWRETRDSFRVVAQTAGVPVSFIGTVGMRDAAKVLAERGVISETTAGDTSDLSAKYQYMYRSSTARSEYLNENMLASYTKSATRVRQELKSGK